ncbi:hypothetical protein COLO4_32559 [Corchorus olitorius]|uniref:Uncharacterized protein n=1 Tax=Corchorus olitorius TaxID=93759 RepID=A0A1R3GYX6_9ROSI|nr:hypothetical protein COLO4_32559 [Corchorus olitorius]
MAISMGNCLAFVYERRSKGMVKKGTLGDGIQK